MAISGVVACHLCKFGNIHAKLSKLFLGLSFFRRILSRDFHHSSRQHAACKQHWDFSSLNAFGSLVLRTGSLASYKISPVDPVASPSQDTATVCIEGNLDPSHGVNIQCERRDDDILLKTRGPSNAEEQVECTVTLPVKFSEWVWLFAWIETTCTY